MAIRPKTLPAAIAPVLIGTAMAYGNGVEHFPSAIAALLGALAIQVATNLANDYFDFKKGADTKERVGPTRVTAAGLVSPRAMQAAMIITFSLAAVISIYLIARAGWPIAVVGALSILSGFFYSAGPGPLGYLGLGEPFVLIFFGPVAVGGTYYVQAMELNWAAVAAGLAPGFLSVAILCVNNLRDIEGDRRAGKKTLAVRFGASFARLEYLFSIAAAGLIPAVIFLMTQEAPWSLLSCGIVFWATPEIKTMFTKNDGALLNGVLARTGKLLMLYSVLFSIGWIVWTF